jgi:prolyl oligopeptidase
MSRRTLAVVMALSLTSVGEVMEPKHAYPPTKVDNVVEELHGVKIVDPYRWLEDGDSEAVKKWVDAQNQFTQDVLGTFKERGAIRKRLGELLDVGSLGTPAPRKGRVFYTKREGTQNQPVLYVRDGATGKDRALIDPNSLAKDGTVAMDWWYPSRDGKMLAYGLSKDGSEQSTLYLCDVESGATLKDVIERTRYSSVAWLPDNSGFYYTRYPKVGSVPKGQENYNRHVFFHKIGTNPDDDPKVFGEGRAPEDMIAVSISPNGRWLAATAHIGWTKTEIYIRDNQQKDAKFVPLVEKLPAIFNITLRDDRFWVHTNHEAPRYRLFRVDPSKLERDQWTEVIPQSSDVLESVAVVGDSLVADYMHQATSKLRLFDASGKLRQEVELPTLGTLAGIGSEWDGNEFYYGFQSFTMAPTVFRFDLASKNQQEWGRVQTSIDSSAYAIEQVKYASKDGTPVTMFLTYKKGMTKNGTNPTLLYGYGGFNISLTPTFNATRFVFLERGGVLAVPNLRGGGEYGEEWHRAGMLDKKQNTFDDFIAAAEWLIQEKVTTKERLAIQGGSNGGLLVGAAVTQRPDLFKAVVCMVPLLDMTRFHRFLIARLWISEYGNPEDAEHFKWISAYSPYQKVKSGTSYPATLITTAASDSRVDPLHARKMAARMQAATTGSAPILLRQETKAGHGQGKPRGLILDEQTDIWTFLFWQLGL